VQELAAWVVMFCILGCSYEDIYICYSHHPYVGSRYIYTQSNHFTHAAHAHKE